jgi:hypothetical protein
MKKILILSLILALALTLILPSVTMAAPPSKFNAQGMMSSIDTGTVKELGHSGKWLVKDRHIDGQLLTGNLGSSNYTITYGGVFDLATQEGNLAGKLVVGSNLIGITGTVAPLTVVYYTPWATYLPKLVITGKWAGLKGLNANGSFEAWMIFVPDTAGHVVAIADSSFVMTGKYSQGR